MGSFNGSFKGSVWVPSRVPVIGSLKAPSSDVAYKVREGFHECCYIMRVWFLFSEAPSSVL